MQKLKYYFAVLILVFTVVGYAYTMYIIGSLMLVSAVFGGVLGGCVITWALVTVLSQNHKD